MNLYSYSRDPKAPPWSRLKSSKDAENKAISVANELITGGETPLTDPKTHRPLIINRNISVSIGIAQFNKDGQNLFSVLEEAEANFKISHESQKNAVVYQGKIVSSGEIPDKPHVGGR